MRQKSPQPRNARLLAAFTACALTCGALACAFALPARVLADEGTVVVAHSIDAGGQRTDYTDIQDALEAGYTGKVIVMDADWIPSEHYSNKGATILVEKNRKITIDMAGHTIGGGGADNAGLCVSDNAECTLTFSVKKTIEYEGVVNVDGKKAPMQVTTGGLVTSDYDGIPGVNVESSGKCTLDGVTVAGCISSGVWLHQDTTLVMKGGATIEHNRGVSLVSTSKSGGGVCATGVNASISMSDSSIRNNFAVSGGGVFIENTGASLTMAGGAVIENNSASCGGGVYIWYVDSGLTMTGGAAIQGNTAETGGGVYAYRSCALKSPDGNGYIKGNTASGTSSDKRSGGGIYVRPYGKLGGSIEGITIADNHSAYDGGGIELEQAATTIKDCAIIGNSATRDGGGVHVDNSNDVIDSCAITGNWCNDDGGSYEGGGVYVGSSYDIKLAGTCVIKGNTRGKGTGNADDVMLRENFGATAKAYITGALEKGSSVGVRTGTTGDRRVAKNFKPESNDCLFYDMDGYYVSYGGDEGGDAWQRHTTKEFTVRLGGEVYGKYRNGATVSLAVPAAKGDGRIFWRWSDEYTTGLNPFSDYFGENGAFSNALAFTMPQNDVGLWPLYVDRVKSAMFAVEAPEAGKPLPTSGQLVRTDGGASASATVPCAVYWYEVGQNGEETYVVGNAKANTTYKAYVSAPASDAYGLYYDGAIKAGDVKVRLVSSSGETMDEHGAADAYVTLSNSLAAKTVTYATGDGAGQGSKTGAVKVQLKSKGLLGKGEAATAAQALGDETDGQAGDAGLIDTVKVSYAYNDEADAVTIAAPAAEGYNFCGWDAAGGADVSDEGAVTIPVSELLKIDALTAVYTPVATALEVKLEAPVAGDPLASTCADVVATCSDGETVSLKGGFNVESFVVAWSPEAENGKAGYSTAYTALIKLCSGEGLEDVEQALASSAVVKVVGADGKTDVEAEAAGFTVVDGKLCLAVTFPATRDAKATSVARPGALELTFEQAKACSELGAWPLPTAVDIEVEGGTAAEGDVEWGSVEGFDAGATGAQELTVKGAITRVATPDDTPVDTSDVSLEVAATIKVAAPTSQGGSAESDSAKPAATATSKAAKKGVPATGDAATAAPAALLALGAASLAAGALTVRFRREK